MNDEKRYEYDGWFPGLEGDDTAYGLFWDTENSLGVWVFLPSSYFFFKGVLK